MAGFLTGLGVTTILLPASGLLEKLSYKLIPEPAARVEGETVELDLHDYSRTLREGNSEYAETYGEYANKYLRSLM